MTAFSNSGCGALNYGQVVRQEHIPLAKRVREVEEGPDGNIQILIDQEDGLVWKLEPMARPN